MTNPSIRAAHDLWWDMYYKEYEETPTTFKAWQAATSAAMQWMPIESAPKDGTVILAYCTTTMPYKRIVPLRWVYVEHLTCDGWIDGNESSWGGITHWMPLPTPPSEQE